MTRFQKFTSLFFVSWLSACSQSTEPKPYAEYLRLTPPDNFNDPAKSERLQPFIALFGSLSPESVEAHFERAYADPLFFNDTFHTFRQRDVLKSYFLKLTQSATTTVTPLDYAENGDQIWLRWKMRTQFKVYWKDIDVTTIGMTHLVFNDEGQIAIHQDYWDGVEGFYSHLPMLGGLVRFVRSGLSHE